MTTLRDPDEIVAVWLDDGPTRLPAQTRRAITVALPTTPQRRRGWSVPWRPNLMSTSLKYAIGAVAVVAIAFGGWFFIAPASPGVGDGPGPTASPSATASPPAPSPSVAPSTGPKAFRSEYFAVPLSLTLVDRWRLDSDETLSVDLQHFSTDLAIMRMASVTVPGATADDPYIPLPADLATWLGQRPEFGPVTTREITVGGRKGTLLDADFTWDGSSDTKIIRYGPSAWNYDRGTSGQRGRFIVLPGAGDTGVVIFMESPIAGFDATAASLDQLLTTLQFR